MTPLRHAHAHNDYEHEHPLFDALEHGFCSVEADVFVVGDELLVGHSKKDLRPDRTLAKLYLDPLRERVRANSGRVYAGGPSVFLLIDMKTSAKPTYAVLDRMLSRYDDMLSVTRNGGFEEKAVTVVLSGTIRTDRATREFIAEQDTRYAGIDGRKADLDSTAAGPSHSLDQRALGSTLSLAGERADAGRRACQAGAVCSKGPRAWPACSLLGDPGAT